jgi:signal peptidase II
MLRADRKSMKVKSGTFSIIALIIVILDQWSKFWAVSALTSAFSKADGLWEKLALFQTAKHPPPIRVISVIDDFWHYRYAQNPGAAFSFLADANASFRVPFFLTVSAIALGAILWYYKNSSPKHVVFRLSLAMVFGGAIGNLIDRARLGYVIDFISWHWYDKAAWPTFNIADSAISVGVVLLLISSFKQEEENKNKIKVE